MCEFLFTSQHFYPWLNSSCSKQVWNQPHTTRLTASRAQPYLELCSSLLRLAKSHTTDMIRYCHQCVTVSAEDQGLAIHQYDLLLPVGLPRPLLFWFLTWFSHLLRKGLFLLLFLSFFLFHRAAKHSMVPGRRADNNQDWAWACAQESRHPNREESEVLVPISRAI